MRRFAMFFVSVQLALGCAPASPVDESEEDVVSAAGIAEADGLGELIDLSSVSDEDSTATLDVESQSSKEVFAGDTRERVKDTSVAPYSSVVMLRVSFASAPDEYTGCTGTMIAPDAVLTAAHCVFNAKEYNGVASAVLVSPGAYVDSQGQQRALPGVGTVRSTKFMFPFAYDDINGLTDQIIQYDYAVIRLPTPLPSVGVRKLAALREPMNTPISMVAYHNDLCGTKNRKGCVKAYPLYVSSDIIRGLHPRTFEHQIDLRPFSSGAGISTGGADGAIVGVQSVESRVTNTAVRLTDDALTNIRRWAGLGS